MEGLRSLLKYQNYSPPPKAITLSVFWRFRVWGGLGRVQHLMGLVMVSVRGKRCAAFGTLGA